MFVWNENKRLSNLEDHNLDFEDAGSVFKSSKKTTETVFRSGEQRLIEFALDFTCLHKNFVILE